MASNLAPSSGKAKTRTKTVFFSLLTLLLLLLAACGQGGSSTTPASKNSVLNIVPSPKGDFTDGFSPYSSNANYGSQGMIYETLLFFNRMSSDVKPWLAQSYAFSSDAKTLTFHLQTGVKWSDGQPLPSADVVFTLQMLKQYPTADGNGLWQYLQGVQAPDSSTVVVTLKQAYTPVLWYLAGQTWIVSQHEYASVGDPTKFADDNPIGTGPFLLKSFAPQLIDLKKNPNYWQPGNLPSVRFAIPLSTRTRVPNCCSSEVMWTGRASLHPISSRPTLIKIRHTTTTGSRTAI